MFSSFLNSLTMVSCVFYSTFIILLFCPPPPPTSPPPPVPPSLQCSSWQMFGWLACHNNCGVGCLRWLALAVLWVLHSQGRTFPGVKEGEMRIQAERTGQTKNGQKIFNVCLFFLMFFLSFCIRLFHLSKDKVNMQSISQPISNTFVNPLQPNEPVSAI